MDVIFISLKDIDSGKHFKSYIITFLVTFFFMKLHKLRVESYQNF